MSIPLRAQYATWLGWLLPPDVPIVFVRNPGQEPDDILVLRADGRFETSLDLSDRPEEVVASAEARRTGLSVTESISSR